MARWYHRYLKRNLVSNAYNSKYKRSLIETAIWAHKSHFKLHYAEIIHQSDFNDELLEEIRCELVENYLMKFDFFCYDDFFNYGFDRNYSLLEEAFIAQQQILAERKLFKSEPKQAKIHALTSRMSTYVIKQVGTIEKKVIHDQSNEIPTKEQEKEPTDKTTLKEYKEMLSAAFEQPAKKIVDYLKVGTEYLQNISKDVSMDEFQKMLTALKPVNAFNLFHQLTACNTVEQMTGVIVAFFELYDIYWDTSNYITPLAFWSIHTIFCKIAKRLSPDVIHDQGCFVPKDGAEYDNAIAPILEELGVEVDISEKSNRMAIAVFGLAVSIGIFLTGGKIDSLKGLTFKNMWSSTQAFAKNIKSIKEIYEYLPKVLTYIFTTVADFFGYDYVTDDDKAVLDFKKKLFDFRKKVNEMADLKMADPAKLTGDPSKMKGLSKIMDDMEEIYRFLLDNKKNLAPVKHVLDEVRTKVRQLHDWYIQNNNTIDVKIEPACLVLGGKPGCGKSKLVEHIIYLLSQKYGESLTNYGRTPSDPFWSGYTGQKITHRDDFGQDKMDTDHLECIIHKSVRKSRLRMADISDKGMFFSSEFLIYTTNDFIPYTSAYVKDPKAITRRFDVPILVVDPNYESFKKLNGAPPNKWVDPETGKIGNPWKINEKGEKEYYYKEDWSHLQFYFVPDVDQPSENITRITVEEIVDKLYDFHLSYKEKYEAYVAKHNVTFEADGTVRKEKLKTCNFCMLPIEENPCPEGGYFYHPYCYHNGQEYEEALSGLDQIYKNFKLNDGASTSTETPTVSSTSSTNTTKWVPDVVNTNYLLDIIGGRDRIKGMERDLHKLKKQSGANPKVSFSNMDEYEEELPYKPPAATLNPEAPIFTFGPPPGLEESSDEEFEIHDQANDENQKEEKIPLPDPDKARNAFTKYFKKKHPIMILSGPPGIGKSMLLKEWEAKNPNTVQYVHASQFKDIVIRKDTVLIDDVSLDEETFMEIEKFCMQVYDGVLPAKRIILTMNPTIAIKFFAEDAHLKRFRRRCCFFDFAFAKKNDSVLYSVLNKVVKLGYYTAEDIRNPECVYAKAVEISHFDYESGKQEFITREQIWPTIMGYFDCNKDAVVETCEYPPAIDPIENPNFEIDVFGPAFEFFSKLYESPYQMVKAIMFDTKWKKGDKSQGAKIATAFANVNGNKPKLPSNLDDFILMINNGKFISEDPFSVKVVDGQGIILYVYTVEKRVRIAYDYAQLSTGVRKSDPIKFTKTAEIAQKEETIVEDIKEKITEIKVGLGLDSLLNFPFVKKLLRVLGCIIKLGLAGASMFFLKQYHTDHAKMAIKHPKEKDHRLKFDEGKKKALRTGRYMDIYDNLVSKFKKESAKSVSKRRAMADLQELYDLAEVSDLQLKDFFEHYDGTMSYWNESDGPNNSSPRPQKIVFGDDIFLEYDTPMTQLEERESDKIIPPEAPSKTLGQMFGIEEERKTVPIQKPLSKMEEIIHSEASLDPSFRNTHTCVTKNTVEIGWFDDGNFYKSCSALMCKGRIGATVAHMFKDTLEGFYIKTNTVTPSYYKVKRVDAETHKKRDLAIFEVEAKCPSYKDITHFFPSVHTNFREHIQGKCANLVSFDRDPSDPSRFITIMRPTSIGVFGHVTTAEGTEKDALQVISRVHGLSTGWINTSNGDCGSVLFLLNPQTTIKVLGIHNSATVYESYCSILCQEFFDNYGQPLINESDNSKLIIPKTSDIVFQPKEGTPSTFNRYLCGLPVVGTTTKFVYTAEKTVFYKCPVAYPEKEFEPSIMCPYDTRNTTKEFPIHNAFLRWNHEQPKNLNIMILNHVVEDVINMMKYAFEMNNVVLSVLTKTEALNAKKDSGLQPIPRDTSAGYPWTNYAKKKQDYMEIHERGNEVYYALNLKNDHGRKLNNAVDELIDISREPNCRPLVCFTGFLKDEPLKISKVEECRTRLFLASPFDYLIAHRKYFGAFIGAQVLCRNLLPGQVGMNPNDGLDWHFMMQDLLATSNIGFDADFKNWDTTVVREFMKRIPQIANAMYKSFDPDWKEEDDIIRTNLHSVLWSPLLLCPDYINKQTCVLQAHGGMVSGQPGTANDNSLIHYMYVLYAWYNIMLRDAPQYATFSEFNLNVRVKTYGDDGIYAVNPMVISLFNFSKFAEEMKLLNVECTPASKDGKVLDFIKVMDFEFLKRKPVRIGGYIYGQLNEKTIRKICAYNRSKSHHFYKEPLAQSFSKTDLFDIMFSALRECVLHSEEKFNEVYDHFQRCLKKIRFPILLPSYRDVKQGMELYF